MFFFRRVSEDFEFDSLTARNLANDFTGYFMILAGRLFRGVFGSSFIQVESRLGIKGITVYVQSEDLIRFVLSDMVGFKTKKEQFHKVLTYYSYFPCFQNE